MLGQKKIKSRMGSFDEEIQ